VASSAYMAGRRSYLNGATRPQAILFSDNAGTLESGMYVPNGNEGEDFIILTDGNRSEISMSNQRIEQRQRMVNGNMRSYWMADKLNLSTSWSRIPSRAYSGYVTFDPENGQIDNDPSTYSMYTVDGGAGGVDILSWYEDHVGPFYVFLGYDKFRIDGSENYNRLSGYNQVLKMYVSSFDYDIEKRGGTSTGNMWSDSKTVGFDFWNISISLEEV
jgi:hypothetical protein